MCLKLFLLILVTITISKNIQASRCPQFWFDASPWNMGCLSFNVTKPMRWAEAQSFCKSLDSHLVEIFKDEQQAFMVMKSYEVEALTGGQPRNWWIGLTDEGTEGIWYWAHSEILAEYTSWSSDEPDNNSGCGDYAYLWGLHLPYSL